MSTDKKTIDWYNTNAQNYTNHVRNPKESIYHAYYEKPAMYNLIPDIQDKIVLSIGCGSGEDSKYLKNKGAKKSVGIDISQELVSIAKSSYPECEFLLMDMEKLAFSENTFDFIYSSLAMHYIQDWELLFSNIYKIVKPNSYFLFSCVHPVKSSMSIIEDTETDYMRQLAINIKRKEKEFEIIGDYFTKRAMSVPIINRSTVTVWHRSIGDIFQCCKNTGFIFDQFIEPQPLEKMTDVSLQDYKKLNKIPEFLVCRLLKP